MTASRAADPTEFDLCGRLPGPGITLLEASAGTGKTYTIAGLVARYIADGLPVDNLLVITFTKAATSELRDRVRQRLVSSLHSLNLALADPGYQADDDLTRLLVDADTATRRLRRDRITRALSAFDSATITTTHGFCESALAELGLAGDGELNPAFVTDSDDIAKQVAADLYVRDFANADQVTRAALTPKAARELVTRVNQDWDAVIEPEQDPSESAMIRVEFARQARAEIGRRKRLAGLMTFDDQIGRLRDAVTNPVRGQHAVAALRDRYRVVLVDEFQDTDLSQWTILERAFGDGTTTLLLIGDPKQAIYAFRGADVYAYLAASDHVTAFATLGTNYRSDPGVLAGLDEIFRGSALGDDRIVYRSVKARPNATDRGPQPPVRLRVVRDTAPVDFTKQQRVVADSGRKLVAHDVAADIVGKLNRGTHKPESFAVLTNTHGEAAAIQQALLQRNVPVVIRANESIFGTTAADAFLRLFQACESPSSARLVRRFALSDLGGWTAHKLAAATRPGSDEAAELAELHTQLVRWAEQIPHGVAGVYAAIKRETGLISRLLAQAGGERRLTDLDQVAELANAHSNQHHANAASMAAWTADRIDQANRVEEDARVRRLDTDAQAVQVITIHAAKGLEFDVVYCPFMWLRTGGGSRKPQTYTFHSDGQRAIYVGGETGAGHAPAKRSCEQELDGESLRKAYVAMTRAKHELVLWWVDGSNSKSTPLGRLLWQDANGRMPGQLVNTDLDGRLADARYLAIENVTDAPAGDDWIPPVEHDVVNPEVATLSRSTDQLWQRTSFTALTRAAHEAHVAHSMRTYEPEVAVTDDEVPVDVDTDALEQLEAETGDQSGQQALFGEPEAPAEADLEHLRELVSPMAACPAGANFGSFVHAVLERIDFAAADLAAEVDRGIAEVARWWSTDVGDLQVLSTALQAALRTPLGPDVGDLSLSRLSRRDRVDEMGFEFALAGGEHPTGSFGVSDLRPLLDQHLDPGDLLRPYLAQLGDAELAAQARGFLSGSIDLVLRTPGPDGEPRYSIVDYKTNRIGDGEVTAWNYQPSAVAETVFAANYPVQFLLYLVALHRYLRWRLPGYDPAIHLGPVKYLFVRGMFGEDTPVVDGTPIGVFTWQPSAELVVALSELLAGGVRQ